MSLKKCSIPGCILASRKNSIKLRMEGIKMSVFLLPRNPELKEKWKKILEERNIKITDNFFVCELHFKQEDISIFPYSKTGDGIVYGKNTRKIMKFGSVPSIFEDISYSAVKMKLIKEGWEETLRTSLHKKAVKIADNVKNTDTLVMEDEDSLMHTKLMREFHPIKKCLVKENTDVSPMEDSFTYTKLLKELHLIKKQNYCWSITNISDYIQFSRTKNSSFEKMVIIDTNMNVKVYVDGIKLNITHLMGFTCINDISSLLKGLEWFKLDIKET